MKDGWMDVLFNREISHLKPIDRIIDPPRFPAGCGRPAITSCSNRKSSGTLHAN
jgi:hypothetical protein